MKYISIKARVTIWFTALMAIIVTLVLVFMLVVNGVGVTYNAEYALLDALEENTERIDYDHGTLDIDNLRFSLHDVYLSVYDEDKNLIAGGGSFRFEGEEQFIKNVTRQVVCNGRDYLVRDEYTLSGNGGLWLRGITLTTNNYSAVHILTIVSVIIFPVLLVISAVGGWFIANHAFKPVRRITETVDAISDGNDLSKRIGLGKGRDEIYRLAGTFDRLLDRLEASFESEKRFASDASHELRTPTAVILAECEYAKEGKKSGEDYRESLEVVERQAKKMSSLINELLSITRMDQGTAKMTIEYANLSDLVEVVCDDIAMADGKAITLKRDITAGISAPLDVGLMTRLVQNLVQNAYKYTPEGGEVRVSLHEEEGMLRLVVADTGIGIAPENLDKIWNRFWQADPSRGEGSGSGLGLSMVKQIAEAHGGTVSVTSEPERGSVFTFTMPV